MPRLQPEDVSGELHRIARMPIAGASATMGDAEAEQERANALGRILDLVPPDLLPAAIALLATLPPAVRSRLMERYVDRARKAAAPAILDAVLVVSDAGARMELLEELARKLPRQSIETAAEAARAALPAVERTGEDAEAENAALFQRHRVADVLLVLARRADVPELRLRLAREARDLALTTPLLPFFWDGAVPEIVRKRAEAHTPKRVSSGGVHLMQTHCYLCPDDAAWKHIAGLYQAAVSAAAAWHALRARLGTYAEARIDGRWSARDTQVRR